jgi:hypothetical protein
MRWRGFCTYLASSISAVRTKGTFGFFMSRILRGSLGHVRFHSFDVAAGDSGAGDRVLVIHI